MVGGRAFLMSPPGPEGDREGSGHVGSKIMRVAQVFPRFARSEGWATEGHLFWWGNGELWVAIDFSSWGVGDMAQSGELIIM